MKVFKEIINSIKWLFIDMGFIRHPDDKTPNQF